MIKTLVRHVARRYTSSEARPYRGKYWNADPVVPSRRQLRGEARKAAITGSGSIFGSGTFQHHRKSLPTISKTVEGARSKEPGRNRYTAAYAMFEGLWEAGVRNCFVNVGSDHPSILEAFVKGKREKPDAFPRMITCPSEMTAISIADGYARVSGHPQAVLVHVDVGTQALAHGVHNASIGRVPVIIIAGLCPSTESGELPGSKTEYSNWLQDTHDQTAIVRQYCRFAGEIRTGVNVKQMLGRVLQFAKSDPKGPVYLSATREVLAQEIEPYVSRQEEWCPISPSGLSWEVIQDIATFLANAKRPLIVTGYSGRDKRTPGLLVDIAVMLPGIRVHDTGGSDMCFPASHPASVGFRLSTDECTTDADFILVLDCDVPWIPSKNPPPPDAKIYHIDSDPLNAQLHTSFFPAHKRWRADTYTVLDQLWEHINDENGVFDDAHHFEFDFDRQGVKYATSAAGYAQAKTHATRLEDIKALARLGNNDALDGHNVGALLKSQLPDTTTFVVEAVTNSTTMHDQLQPSTPGKWLNCGATGIGWSNGAAVGVKLALQDEKRSAPQGLAWQVAMPEEDDMIVCQIVGDGSFMCAAPESALWVARKYEIPILTVVLNNGGWNAPRNSVEMVYPDGLNKGATADELNLSFKPSPNYAAMAEAVAGGEEGWMKGVRVRNVKELKEALEVGMRRVQEQARAMLIEALIG